MLSHAVLAIAALLASGTSAARLDIPPPNPLPERAMPIPAFIVTNFAAGAVAMSDRNYITFDVVISPNSPVVHCHAVGTTRLESLTSIRQTWCDSSWPSPTTLSPWHTTSTAKRNNNNNNNNNNNTNPLLHQPQPHHTEDVWFTFTVFRNPSSSGSSLPDPSFFGGEEEERGKEEEVRDEESNSIPEDKRKRNNNRRGIGVAAAELRIVRQVDARVRDEGVYRVAAEDAPFVERQSVLVHQVYRGPENFTVDALRFEAV